MLRQIWYAKVGNAPPYPDSTRDCAPEPTPEGTPEPTPEGTPRGNPGGTPGGTRTYSEHRAVRVRYKTADGNGHADRNGHTEWNGHADRNEHNGNRHTAGIGLVRK